MQTTRAAAEVCRDIPGNHAKTRAQPPNERCPAGALKALTDYERECRKYNGHVVILDAVPAELTNRLAGFLRTSEEKDPKEASSPYPPNQHRLNIPNVYTPAWWYAAFPNHYAGESAPGNRQPAPIINEHHIDQLIRAFNAIKTDRQTLLLQNEFSDEVHH